MRDLSIDVLRGIAIVAIVAAHVLPSEVLWQFFDYNVCLIVFLSGVSYMMSSAKTSGGYKSYVIKRIKRILLPTWAFLIAYYGAIFLYHVIQERLDSFSVNSMVRSFALQTGWYVWVMRVFLITALIAPLLNGIKEKVGKWGFTILCGAILIIYEFVHISDDASVLYFLTMTIPYIVVFSVGMLIMQFNKQQQIIMAIVFLVVFIAFGYKIALDNGCFLCTNNYKCPPLLYFSSFGLGCSIVFWLLKDTIHSISRLFRIDKLMTFVGSHTMWFYLLHIPVVTIVSGLSIPFIFRFLVTFIVTLLVTYVFVKFIEKVVLTHINNEKMKKNIRLVFLG